MTTLLEQAHRVSTWAPLPLIASEVQEVLGQRQVAFAIGIKASKEVGRWAAQQARPREDTSARLRTLFRLLVVLQHNAQEPEEIRAWMLGANPGLDEQAPITAFREGRCGDVLRAAESFALQGRGGL